MFNSLRLHGLQHARLPCPSSSPWACSHSHPLSQWCHPTILSSVVPFSSCLQSFPALGSFPMSRLFTSGGQNIGASALTLVFPMNIHDWFLLSLTGLLSYSPRDSKESSPTPLLESTSYSVLSLLYGPTFTSIHDYWNKPELSLYGTLSANNASAF